MRLPSKLLPLQRRCATNQLRCEVRIAQYQQELQEIELQIAGITLEIDATLQLLQTHKPQNSTLNRAGFFDLLRKQAKVRRQIQHLTMQRTNLLEQKTHITIEKNQVLQERTFWIRKQDKFQHWLDQYRYKTRLERLSREENEIQEIMTWTT
jgi:hypothetical protein